MVSHPPPSRKELHMKKLLCAILTTVLLLTAVSCQKTDEPISVTKIVHGCELTVTLDKSKYGLGDTVKATVSLVNKGENDVGLFASQTGHFISDIFFYEDNIIKYDYCTEYIGNDAEDVRLLKPGESLTHVREFTPSKPLDATKPAANLSAEWKLIAKVTITPETSEDFTENYDNDEFETVSLEITVPH